MSDNDVITMHSPGGGVLLIIKTDGTIVFGPNFTTTDAASLEFWNILKAQFPGFRAKELFPDETHRDRIARALYNADWQGSPNQRQMSDAHFERMKSVMYDKMATAVISELNRDRVRL